MPTDYRPRHLRFSLRWALAATALFAVALYVLFQRPTVAAKRFIAAIEARDFKQAQALMARGDGDSFGDTIWKIEDGRPEATLSPRSSEDLWRFQRRLHLIIKPRGDRGVGLKADLVAPLWGVRQPRDYSPFLTSVTC